MLQLIHNKQVVERSVATTQHTLHHNDVLLQQHQDEIRTLMDKYRQMESMYRYQSSRASSLDTKLDECIKEKLAMGKEIRRLRHEVARLERSNASTQSSSNRWDASAGGSAQSGGVDSRRLRDEQLRVSESRYGEDDESLADDDDDRYPPPLSPASPIRHSSYAERPRVDLTPSVSSADFRPAASQRPSAPVCSAVPLSAAPASHRIRGSESRAFSHNDAGARSPFASNARRYSHA